MNTLNIEKSRYRANSGVKLRYVVFGILSFVVIGLLLNASALEKKAELMEFGIRRDLCLSVIQPVSTLSAVMRIDLFRNWLEGHAIMEG